MSGALELLDGVVGADDMRAFALWEVLRVQSKVDLAKHNRPLPVDVPWRSWVHYLALRAVVCNALYTQAPRRFLDAFANAAHSSARSFTGASVLVVTLRSCLLGWPAHSAFWHDFGGAREGSESAFSTATREIRQESGLGENDVIFVNGAAVTVRHNSHEHVVFVASLDLERFGGHYTPVGHDKELEEFDHFSDLTLF